MLGQSTILQAMRQIHTHNFCFLEAIMMIKKEPPCSVPCSISDVLSLNLGVFLLQLWLDIWTYMTQFSKIEKNDAESTHSLVVKLYYGKESSIKHS